MTRVPDEFSSLDHIFPWESGREKGGRVDPMGTIAEAVTDITSLLLLLYNYRFYENS